MTWSHPAIRIMFATSLAVIGARDLSFCVFLGNRISQYDARGVARADRPPGEIAAYLA